MNPCEACETRSCNGCNKKRLTSASFNGRIKTIGFGGDYVTYSEAMLDLPMIDANYSFIQVSDIEETRKINFS